MTGIAPSHLRNRSTHCARATVTTAVDRDVWASSLYDALLDPDYPPNTQVTVVMDVSALLGRLEAAGLDTDRPSPPAKPDDGLQLDPDPGSARPRPLRQVPVLGLGRTNRLFTEAQRHAIHAITPAAQPAAAPDPSPGASSATAPPGPRMVIQTSEKP